MDTFPLAVFLFPNTCFFIFVGTSYSRSAKQISTSKVNGYKYVLTCPQIGSIARSTCMQCFLPETEHVVQPW